MTYRYTMCGLDYIHLRNGYRVRNTDYGTGVSIERADELDRMIAWTVIFSHSRLRGQEVRFFRSLIDCSQAELAAEMGVKRITVARWESGTHTPIPGPADRLLRVKVAHDLFTENDVQAVVELLPEITDTEVSKIIMSYLPDTLEEEPNLFPDDRPDSDGWKPSKAA